MRCFQGLISGCLALLPLAAGGDELPLDVLLGDGRVGNGAPKKACLAYLQNQQAN